MHNWYCTTIEEVTTTKWKGFVAVLLGLLMVGVTAGSVAAAPQNFTGKTPKDVIWVPEEYIWKITYTSSFYTTYGAWRTCVSGYGSPPDSLTCGFTEGRSYTWHNTISGELEVSPYKLSVAVGFDVTKSGSVERSATYHYRYPNQHLAIQYRDIYKTKRVIQTKYYVDRWGREHNTGEHKTVYASKWDHIEFRAINLGVNN